MIQRILISTITAVLISMVSGACRADWDIELDDDVLFIAGDKPQPVAV